MNQIQSQAVFFEPGKAWIYDYAVCDENGIFFTKSGESIAQINILNPNVILGDMELYNQQREAILRTSPVEITEERFLEMMNILPPLGWRNAGFTESFKMCEMTSGNFTGIFARIGKRYFTFQDLVSLPHHEIVSKINLAFPDLH
jgi:hypothetical protein